MLTVSDEKKGGIVAGKKYFWFATLQKLPQSSIAGAGR